MENNRVRKRTTNACQRCRQQKIRCSGSQPCIQCSKRKADCIFEDRSQKIFVTKGYLDDLEQRLAKFEQGLLRPDGTSQRHAQDQGADVDARTDADAEADGDEELGDDNDTNNLIDNPDQNLDTSTNSQADIVEDTFRSGCTSPEPPLVNQLASGVPVYIPDSKGNPIYLGTSSNWSFGRRVLALAHERITGAPMRLETLLFEGQNYTLDWADVMPLSSAETLKGVLPSSDFAIYLINSVKFHCGQIFHLFEEEEFMHNFTAYHDGRYQDLRYPEIWHVHYLLILALGKAFIVSVARGDQPPGADLFVLAMKYLPAVVFLHSPKVEVMELLCCAALYLHSLDFRTSAYTIIGQALRLALQRGLHTDMKSQHITETFAERSRKIWWTILVLDRQMSAISGLPMAVRDEDISADLPRFPSSPLKEKALQLHIVLSKLIAEVVNTVYGIEGRLGKEYLMNTKAVLKKIADTTDHLNESFHIPMTGSLAGLSRLSAYLHLLHHQSVILATRPLFYSFFSRRLDSKNPSRCYVPQSGSVRALLTVGIESAQRILRILSALQSEGILETFLPFDLDSTFSSITILHMANAADNTLTGDCQPWTKIADGVFTEMTCRGNRVAGCLKSEMEQFQDLLNRLPATNSFIHQHRSSRRPRKRPSEEPPDLPGQETCLSSEYSIPSVPLQIEEIDWQEGFTAEHLLHVADSLDLDGLDWLSTSTFNEMLT